MKLLKVLFYFLIAFIKDDKRFKLILHFILRIANYLNNGTAKGNATVILFLIINFKGLTIDSLSIIDSIKSCDKKTTILHYIVKQISV